MPRTKLTDEDWKKVLPILNEHRIYNKADLRRTFEGILYRIRVGCPWRDLPEYFGKWSSVYKRFNEWCREEKLMSIFKALCVEPDMEWTFIDGSIVKAHQHSAGAQNDQETGIGKSVAGNTTKIHLAVDSCGFPIDFTITGGEVHDVKEAPSFIAQLPKSDYKIMDKGYDCESLREQIKQQKCTPIIPRKSNSTIGNVALDWGLYKYRHLVENAFARLKHFRGVATRFDKLKRNFVGVVALACAIMWIKM
jgi:transposase